jgi:hypothetical protein
MDQRTPLMRRRRSADCKRLASSRAHCLWSSAKSHFAQGVMRPASAVLHAAFGLPPRSTPARPTGSLRPSGTKFADEKWRAMTLTSDDDSDTLGAIEPRSRLSGGRRMESTVSNFDVDATGLPEAVLHIFVDWQPQRLAGAGGRDQRAP